MRVEPSATPDLVASDGFGILDNVGLLYYADPCSIGVLTSYPGAPQVVG